MYGTSALLSSRLRPAEEDRGRLASILIGMQIAISCKQSHWASSSAGDREQRISSALRTDWNGHLMEWNGVRLQATRLHLRAMHMHLSSIWIWSPVNYKALLGA